MITIKRILFLLVFLSCFQNIKAEIDEDKLGSWYMLFWNAPIKSNFGLQGDLQHRNWNIAGDLEQLLLRGGVTYTPKNTSIKFTLGYGHITTGSFGEDNAKVFENRIYQEALYPLKLGKRVYLNHRFRFEQRFLTDNFKTRYRYNLFLNVPLNNEGFDTNTIYLALYNEIFVGGYNQTLSSSETEHFDRNRFYSGVGYVINKSLRVQLGYMNQHTNSWVKNQLQFSLHYNRPAKD